MKTKNEAMRLREGNVMRVTNYDRDKGSLDLENKKGETAAYHRASGRPVGEIHDLQWRLSSHGFDVVNSSLMNDDKFPDTLSVVELSARVPPIPAGPILPEFGIGLIRRYDRDDKRQH